MFIRVKKVKKPNGRVYEYAHLVCGVWRRRRWKFIDNERRFLKKFNNSIHNYYGFVGRVYRFNSLVNLSLEEFLGGNFEEFVDNNQVDEIYRRLLEHELVVRGFRKKKNVYFRENVFVDFNRMIVHDGKSDVVVKLQDFGGYLCGFNLDELFSIKKISNRYEGIYFMKRLRMVGVKLSPDQFFILANKLLHEEIKLSD